MPRLSKIGAAALAAFGWSGGVSAVTASYLVVAGGGGGGSGQSSIAGGGGGAGGLLTGTSSLNPTVTYTVTVGAGGTGAVDVTSNSNTNGTNSVFNAITATAGGAGGTTGTNTGQNGGSGGGGSNGSAAGTGVSGQGFAGGVGQSAGSSYGGGGGGAGAAGTNGSSGVGGTGGVGIASSITGTSTYYAGGGGGGIEQTGGTAGAGGAGGGGTGNVGAGTNGASGTANTGGGGGGAGKGTGSAAINGGNGGSGVVIVSYPAPQLFWGGFVTTSGSNIIHTFTTSGSLAPITTSVSASYLVVGGGGGGGGASINGVAGAGGGAGGFRTGTTSLSLASSYTVLVGAGGTGGAGGSVSTGYNGTNGSGSTFNSITSAGGGFGACYNQSNYSAPNGGSGGSGGGCVGAAGTPGSGNTPSTSPSQGNNAGTSLDDGGSGGGGAGAVGSNATTTSGGNGGAGAASSISGTSVYYAGGGAGAGRPASGGTNGTGGIGGGGTAAAINPGNAGTTNLGGGGAGNTDGANNTTAGYFGGQGGSGVVIVSYPGSQLFGGGVVTFVNGYTIHTFNTSGTLIPIVSLSASYLIVAGGAGGGSLGGGGGAGGLLSGAGVAIDTNSTYLVTVGSGGTGGTGGNIGTNGANSSFSVVPTTAIGGGAGAPYDTTSGGSSGGSGGGAGVNSAANTRLGGAGTTGQGNAGGSHTSLANYSGGGGGAGAVGGDASSGVSGSGGAGTSSSISGTATYYAGGGGGGTFNTGTAGTGGTGGGGAGSTNTNATSGTANLGAGGGGGGWTGGGYGNGGNGGSGVVIISYAGSTQLMAGGTVTISGGNVIHTFTSSGYLAPLKFVGNSLRFRASNSAYLNRSFNTPTNQRIWTWSSWVKRGSTISSGSDALFASSDNYNTIRFQSTDELVITGDAGGSMVVATSAVYRDPAAWYHFVVAFDSTQATSSNRVKFYVNGTQVTSFSTATYPPLNATYGFNSSISHAIGRRQSTSNLYFDGEMTEINFIDGQALTANSFGTFNSYGVWQPITYGGSYGTNGFYLPMNPGSSTYNGSFNGSSQLISAPSNAVFNFTGDFTAECWVNTSTITNATQPTLFTIGSDSGGLVVGFYSGAFYCYMAGTGGLMSSATLPLNQWVHVAWVRVGSTNTLYLNGALATTATNSSTLSSTGGVTVGKTGSSGSSFNYFQGYVSNFRVNNTALYTASFTPPTSPLTAVSGTQLLTLQNSTIIDNSTNAFTITNTGSVATTVAYPFNLNKTIDYSPAGNNWTNNNIGMVVGTTFDSMTDVPTLTSTTAANYAVANPLINLGGIVNITNGNLTATKSGNGDYIIAATQAIPAGTGKWYWEVTATTISASSNFSLGVVTSTITTGAWATSSGSAVFWNGSSGSRQAYGVASTGTSWSVASGDVIGQALDATTGNFSLYKNGTLVETWNASVNTALSSFPFASSYATSESYSYNFGQQPFKYTAPTGFLPLNTYNL